MERAFYSNDLDNLLGEFKKNIYKNKDFSIQRIVVVPTIEIKQWIYHKISTDANFNGFGFVSFVLAQNIPSLFGKLFSLDKKIPNLIELKFAIEQNLLLLLKEKENLLNEISDFSDLLYFLDINDKKDSISYISDKKISDLSTYLADLFLLYSIYGISQDDKNSSWQKYIYDKTYNHYANFYHDKNKTIENKGKKIELHLFHLSFISETYLQIFQKLDTDINYYIFSPCKYYWEDIVSEKDKRYILKKGKNNFSKSSLIQYEEYLDDTNELLANFGKVQRTFLSIVDKETTLSNFCYNDPEENWLENENIDLSLLDSLKADMLHLRNINSTPRKKKINIDSSLQLHVATTKKREIEILYDNLLKNFSSKNSDLQLSDITVYAPDIETYAPYIHLVFSNNASNLKYKILNLDNVKNSFYANAVLSFFSLVNSRWEQEKIVSLLENPVIYKSFNFTKEDIDRIISWIEKVNISWGIDGQHKKKMLSFEKNLDLHIKSWKYGIKRILLGFVFFDEIESLGLKKMSFSDSELFEKFYTFFEELEKDIAFFESNKKKTPAIWAKKIKEVSKKYFTKILDDFNEEAAFSSFESFIDKFFETKELIQSDISFDSIYPILINQIKRKISSFNKTEVNAITFTNLSEAVPSTLSYILGMDEDFPPKETCSSLNLLKKEKVYIPTKNDFYRNIFLQILHLTKSELIVSYTSVSAEAGAPIKNCSGIINELLSYVKSAYSLNDEQIESLVINHPSHSIDKRYFEKKGNKKFQSFSRTRYLAAKAYISKKDRGKKLNDILLSNFGILSNKISKPEFDIIDIKDLNLLFANPIKFFLNTKLNVFLERKEEDAKIKDFQLSFLDKYLLRKDFLSSDIDERIETLSNHGCFPIGEMKKIATAKIKKEFEYSKQFLDQIGFERYGNKTIFLDENIEEKEELENGVILLPAIEVFYQEKKIKIIGRISNISNQGLISLQDDNLGNKIKTWPNTVIFLHIAKHFFNVKRALHFVKSNSIYDLEDVNEKQSLISLIEYYHKCEINISPINPKWSKGLVTNNYELFRKDVESFFDSEKDPIFKDPYFEYLFSGGHKNVDFQKIYNDWSDYSRKLFSPLLSLKMEKI